MKLNKMLELYETVTVNKNAQTIDRADHFYKERRSVFYTKSYVIEQSHDTLEITVTSR